MRERVEEEEEKVVWESTVKNEITRSWSRGRKVFGLYLGDWTFSGFRNGGAGQERINRSVRGHKSNFRKVWGYKVAIRLIYVSYPKFWIFYFLFYLIALSSFFFGAIFNCSCYDLRCCDLWDFINPCADV